jgi:hypothetical protein
MPAHFYSFSQRRHRAYNAGSGDDSSNAQYASDSSVAEKGCGSDLAVVVTTKEQQLRHVMSAAEPATSDLGGGFVQR